MTKKIISLLLIFTIVCSISITPYAIGEDMYICPNGHEYSRWDVESFVSIAATCVQKGLEQSFCPTCGELSTNGFDIELNPYGHTNIEIIPELPPDCISDGHTQGEKCLDCGEYVTIPEEIPYTGHFPNDPIIEDGYSVIYCSICGEEVNREQISEPEQPKFDTNDYTQGTQVQYVGTGSESYTITVPAELKPGQSGAVTLSGTWASDKTIKVTAESTVTLTNSINTNDKKVLNITFAGISEAGSNTTIQTFTKDISVDDITDALFGTWSGKFNYNVELC